LADHSLSCWENRDLRAFDVPSLADCALGRQCRFRAA
jgi:hypothetical protein